MTLRILIILYISISCIGVASAKQRLVFSGIKGSVNSLISFNVIKEAYEKLGIDVEYLPLPGERALRTSNAGAVDGELFRIANVQKKYNNLVPIPTSINVLEGVAFSKNPNLIIKGWNSLEHLNIGIQVGIKFAERGTKGMRRTVVDTNEQLFKMLASDRVDVAVVALTNGLKTINELKLAGLQAISPSIQQFPLYHYLHKKHQALVPQLDAVLKEMKKSGRIMQIRNAAVKALSTGKLK